MRAYMINLDSDADRLDWMRGQFHRAGIAGWERVPAVDLRGAAGRARAAEWAHLPRARLAPAEVGCLMSHAEVWRRIVARGERLAAVFEDDVSLAPDLGGLLADDGWIPPGVHLLRLETSLRQVQVSRRVIARHGATEIRDTFHNRQGTAGYVISPVRAQALLEAFDANPAPADIFMFSGRMAHRVSQMIPAPCVQTKQGAGPEFESSIREELRARVGRHGRPPRQVTLARAVAWLQRQSFRLRERPELRVVPFAE